MMCGTWPSWSVSWGRWRLGNDDRLDLAQRLHAVERLADLLEGEPGAEQVTEGEPVRVVGQELQRAVVMRDVAAHRARHGELPQVEVGGPDLGGPGLGRADDQV